MNKIITFFMLFFTSSTYATNFVDLKGNQLQVGDVVLSDSPWHHHFGVGVFKIKKMELEDEEYIQISAHEVRVKDGTPYFQSIYKVPRKEFDPEFKFAVGDTFKNVRVGDSPCYNVAKVTNIGPFYNLAGSLCFSRSLWVHRPHVYKLLSSECSSDQVRFEVFKDVKEMNGWKVGDNIRIVGYQGELPSIVGKIVDKSGRRIRVHFPHCRIQYVVGEGHGFRVGKKFFDVKQCSCTGFSDGHDSSGSLSVEADYKGTYGDIGSLEVGSQVEIIPFPLRARDVCGKILRIFSNGEVQMKTGFLRSVRIDLNRYAIEKV